VVSQQQPEPSLHRKLTEVMASVDWQKKTGRNTQQNYNFVTAEQIKDSVRGALAERRVMVYTSVKSVDRSEWQTKGGTTMFSATIHGEVTFADGDSGELFTVEAAGEGMDSGDKALNKAQTAMLKYALINTFLIPTGDDPEQDSPEVTTRARRPAEAPRTAPEPRKPEAAATDTPHLSDDDWAGLIDQTPAAKPTALTGDGLSWKALAGKLNEAGIDLKDASAVGKRMFGQSKWKVADLTDEERAALWAELEPVAA
jgi:hypothetical protein